MRIVIVGPAGPDTLEFNLRDTLQRMGHDAVAIYDRDVSWPYRSPKLRRFLTEWQRVSIGHARALHERMARRTLEFRPDFVIVTPRTAHPVLAETLKAERPKLPVVHINPDAPGTIGRGYLFLSPYDAYFTKDPFIRRFMRDKLGLNAILLPEAYNPYYHIRPELPKAEAEGRTGIDVMVMGSLYAYRSVFLDRLVSAGVKLTVFGRRLSYVSGGWADGFRGEYVVGARKAELIYGSKIVLNAMSYMEVESVNAKFFEILGCEGFQICDWKPVVPDLAEPGREVVTFRTVDEAVEKIRYYLAHDERRWAIARAGYERARREHTYEHRFARVFAEFPHLQTDSSRPG